jgi:hypothetical protein
LANHFGIFGGPLFRENCYALLFLRTRKGTRTTDAFSRLLALHLCRGHGDVLCLFNVESDWFDVTDGLSGASDVTTSKGFGISLANALGGLLRRNVRLDDARGDSKVGRLLGGGLNKTGSLPLD